MALGLAVSAQAGVSQLDRVAHAVGQDHAPNPAVGQLHYDHDSADGHEAAPADHHDHEDPGVPHHHHHFIDTPVALGGAAAEQAPAAYAGAGPARPGDSPPHASAAPDGLDRPPKRLEMQA